ncbi:hypothetical protein LO771_18640 [Streptacidiphilus sp. ASG 303]|uniref:trypsin-like serine peptidase n=1 Tax=Streptacidiphilus sp. ASG 303 TaxID=2896847 RepID=UPI001E3BB80F|nr:hypothetical protein [Streptacidiphilus sp. ASG 303]MCD0484357.1 hypothetical protein [Streptacidiphilus sp. ASG 303]
MTDHRPPLRRLRSRAPLAAAALLLAGVLAPAAAAAPAAGSPAHDAARPRPTATASAGVTASRAEAARIDAYWTKARMRAARAMPMPRAQHAPKGAAGAPSTAGKPERPGTPRSVPGSAPEQVQRDSSGPENATGPLQVPTARRWGGQGMMPARSIGQLYFTTPVGDARCSAAVVSAENRDTVWTAGHCVHPGAGGKAAFYRNFVFVPDAGGGTEPYGRWTFRYAGTTPAWQNTGDWHYDVAALAFYPQAARGDLEDTVGAQGIRFDGGTSFSDVFTFGYPLDGYRRTDLDGQDLWYCEGPVSPVGAADDTLVLRCDMGHGCSGGPWVAGLGLGRGWGWIVGVSSHRDTDSTGAWTNGLLYGTHQGTAAARVYDDVSTH